MREVINSKDIIFTLFPKLLVQKNEAGVAYENDEKRCAFVHDNIHIRKMY